MSATELAILRLELVELTRLSFAECRRLYADQTIYAYALVLCSLGGEAYQPWCHSEKQFGEKEAKWPRERGGGLRRYCPDEWWSLVSGPVTTKRGWTLEKVGEGLDAVYEQYGEEDRYVVLELLTDTLEALDREGFFGTGAAREAVTLMVYMCDSGGDWWEDSVRRLNPPAVVKRFERALDE